MKEEVLGEPNSLTLSEDEEDLIVEIFNMGMGTAVNAISEIEGINYEVEFSLPKAKILMANQFMTEIESLGEVGLISQEYTGELTGKAIMFYPEISGKKLANLLIGTSIPPEQIEKLELDALIEIGNIFINASISCLANFLDTELETSIPQIIFKENLQDELLINKQYVIHLEAPFSVEEHDVNGVIAFILDNRSTKVLLNRIDGFMNED